MNKLNIIALIGILFIGVSCNNDPFQKTEGADTAEKVVLQLSLSTTELLTPAIETRGSDKESIDVVVGQHDPSTRAVNDVKIDNVCLFVFDGKSSNLISADYYSNLDSSSEALLDISLNKIDEYNRFYVVANMGDITGKYIVGSTTIDQFKAESCQMATAADVTPGDLIPMIGLADINTASGKVPPIYLTRMVAKLDLTCKTELVAGSGTLEISAISLNNVPTFVNFTGGSVTDPGSDNTTQHSLTSGSYTSGTPLTCYIPENLRGENAAITTAAERSGANVPTNATYIDIKGTYTKASVASNVLIRIYMGSGDLKDFNVARNTSYTVAITIKEINDSDPRVEVITDLNDLSTANCYVITQNKTTYSFNATVKGNGSTSAGNTLDETKLSPISAKVLWEMGADPAIEPTVGDIIEAGSVTLQDGKVSFKSGTKPGNAVIAVYDGANATGNIIWSWHIWKPTTEMKPFACRTIVYSGDGDGSATPPNTLEWSRDFNMMDRNLGAMNNEQNDVKAYGMLYQWGRKDPFPGAQTLKGKDFGKTTPADAFPTPITTTAEFGSIEGSIKNPTLYLSGMRSASLNPNHRDWLYGGVKNENLWGNPNTTSVLTLPNKSQGTKSIYDPCPPGWRVPASDTWYKVKVDAAAQCEYTDNGVLVNIGVTDDEKMFFPAPGSRYHYMTGQLLQAGERSIYFTTSPHLNSANPIDAEKENLTLSFEFYVNSSFTMLSMAARSSGSSVRCTSEP